MKKACKRPGFYLFLALGSFVALNGCARSKSPAAATAPTSTGAESPAPTMVTSPTKGVPTSGTGTGFPRSLPVVPSPSASASSAASLVPSSTPVITTTPHPLAPMSPSPSASPSAAPNTSPSATTSSSPSPSPSASPVASPIVDPAMTSTVSLRSKLGSPSRADAKEVMEDTPGADVRTPTSPQLTTYPSKKGFNRDSGLLTRAMFRVPPAAILVSVPSLKLRLKNVRVFLEPKAKRSATGVELCLVASAQCAPLDAVLAAKIATLKAIAVQDGGSLVELPELEIDLLGLLQVTPDKSASWIADQTKPYADPDYRKLLIAMGPGFHFESGIVEPQFTILGTAPAPAPAGAPIAGEEDSKAHVPAAKSAWTRSNESAADPLPAVSGDLRYAFPGETLRFEKNQAFLDPTLAPRFERTYHALQAETSRIVAMTIVGYSDRDGSVKAAAELGTQRARSFLNLFSQGRTRWPFRLQGRVLADTRQKHRIELVIRFAPAVKAADRKEISARIRTALDAIWK